jgi:hypothetical protein
MGINTIPMRTFLLAIEKWVESVENRRVDDARFFVEQLHVASEMLAIDPEFKRIFAGNRGECAVEDPEDAFCCLHAFFLAVTDASQPGRFRANDI